MNTRHASLRWIVLVGVLVGFAAVVMFLAPGDLVVRDLPPQLADEPDIYVEDGVITQFDNDGALQYRLRAERITHHERDQHWQLAAPSVELHEATGAPWHVESRSGEMRTVVDPDGVDEARLELHGSVKLAQDPPGDGFTEVSTESMVVYPGRQLARTDQPVMIETNTGRVRAPGLEVDLGNGRMKLLSASEQRVSILVPPDRLTSSPR